MTAFEIGNRDQDFQIARFLLAVPGINLNQAKQGKVTPLHYSIARRSDKVIELLLTPQMVKKGLLVNVVDAAGNTPLTLAIENDDLKTVRKLIQLGADPNETISNVIPLLLASRAQNIPIMKELLAIGANPNLVIEDGDTIVFDAIGRGLNESAKQLLKSPVVINHQNYLGQTAFVLAVLNGDPDIVETLLKKGADTSMKDFNGNTVYDFLARSKNRDN